MCNIDRVSRLLSAANIALSAAMVVMAIVVANAGGLQAFGNPPLLIAATITVGIAAGLYGGALAEIQGCIGSVPCGGELTTLRNILIGLIADVSILTGLMIALTIIVWIPAIALPPSAGVFLFFSVIVAAGAIAILSLFSDAVNKFNHCQTSHGAQPLSPWVSATIIIALICVGLFVAAASFNYIPKIFPGK